MRKYIICLIAILLPYFSYTQDCFNADLEDGTLSGYTAYHGRITRAGNVFIETPGIRPSQHKIMHISEGFDPIAEANCVLNNMLPLVPPAAGQYTLRLGNSASGSQAERVLLRFTVTPELTFFLLRYAVVLNDPDHEPFEQPRFELRILDDLGNAFPCGEYQVRAAKNIPGFESCSGGWRVRPWTTVGFELQSFLGQEIQIEILTTDCSQGGHAGYAYLDISCQPLEIKLENYCPGSTNATMNVTDGFVDYKWSTGDTTNSINIQNPLPGTPYQVTVTSATGCTLVLEETIPDLEAIPEPVFTPEADRTFCRDTSFWFQPKGQHLTEVYSPTLGQTADSFLISTTTATSYTFIASDKYNCNSDSLQLAIKIAPPNIYYEIDPLLCFGDATGRIQLDVQSDFLPIRYKWETGETTKDLLNLPAGNYNVTILDQISCTNTASFTLSTPPPLQLDVREVNPIICHGNSDGQLEIIADGGVRPYVYQMNNHPFTNPMIDNLSAGVYSVRLLDAHGCETENTINLIEPPRLNVDAVTLPVSCFGNDDGEIDLTINGGVPTYNISWNDARYDGETSMPDMVAGTYTATITDGLGCTIRKEVTVFQPPFSKDCGTYIPNIFSPNGDGINDAFFVAGSINGIAIERMEIYNRWGEMVFKKAEGCNEIGNKNCGWTGRIGTNTAPTGVYVYLIEIRYRDMPQTIIFSGEVHLLK